jgi:hypothetical protein
MSSPALRDEPYGNGPSRLSALEGPNRSTPAGSAGSMGDAVRPAAPSPPSLKLWSVSDLRTAGRGRRGQKVANGKVIPLCGTQLIKPPACGRSLTEESP